MEFLVTMEMEQLNREMITTCGLPVWNNRQNSTERKKTLPYRRLTLRIGFMNKFAFENN